ncbi:hypothetical protein NA56DRAFT_282038 [Hyaloscypha hepaticicola]|uniref:Uncharacterized protein n=1 Tax=Hyaloscypha hepaticicola TaxID=2082293 RepID=A0A2J6PT79_9HELO|nr:hypothetical protein NA56DRAFT_282038 [Hyaloscypha hepaticicola]
MDSFSGQEPINSVYIQDLFLAEDMRSGENPDITRAFLPTTIESADTTNPFGSYKEQCPYNCDDLPFANKKFRLIEEFPDGLVYIGDSFGFHAYIDATEERACPAECLCRMHDEVPDTFTFIAEKSSDGQLLVTIVSDDLNMELAKITDLEGFRPEKDLTHIPVDGFLFLRSYESLRIHLKSLQSSYAPEPPTSYLISELELLVDHFLGDGEVFKSYGFETLYENGFLTYEHWKIFQQTKLQRDISALDEGFCAVDNLADGIEGEELLTSPSPANSNSSLKIQTLETEPGISSSLNDSEEQPERHSTFPHVDRGSLLTDEPSNTATDLNPMGLAERFLRSWLLDRAISEGDLTSVEWLLDKGADVNRSDDFSDTILPLRTRQYIPVVKAAKAGQGKVVRMLLQRGASASDLESLMTPKKKELMKRERQYRHLRKQFLQQHLLMEEAAQSSTTEFQQLGKSFQNHREAWAAGIRTMRRLCNGKSPQGLHNIAAFLCICKAMSETLDESNDGYYSAQFLDDLERWQVLFKPKELGAYQALIHSMWGVCLPESAPQSWEASEFLTLTHFQSLLSAFISQEENLSFHNTHKHGLESSQRRFLSRNDQYSAHLNTLASVSALDPSEGKDSQSLETPPPELPDKLLSARTNGLEENIESDLSAACLNVTVVLLMAGAIFAIIIIFFQGIGGSSKFINNSCVRPIHSLVERYQILRTYLNLKIASAAFKHQLTPNLSEATLSAHSQISPSPPLQTSNTPVMKTNPDTIMAFTDISFTLPKAQQSSFASSNQPQKTRRQCPTCNKKVLATNMKRHMKDHTGENKVNCLFCGKSLGRKEYMQRHVRERCPARKDGANFSEL